MSAHSLRARLGSLYILCGHGRAHLTCQLGPIAALGLNDPYKNSTKLTGNQHVWRISQRGALPGAAFSAGTGGLA